MRCRDKMFLVLFKFFCGFSKLSRVKNSQRLLLKNKVGQLSFKDINIFSKAPIINARKDKQMDLRDRLGFRYSPLIQKHICQKTIDPQNI